MKRVITLNVTQELIDNGVPDNPWKCPVAQALNIATGQTESEASHNSLTIFAIDPTDSDRMIPWHCRTPEPVYEFVKQFDSLSINDVPQPFKLQLTFHDNFLQAMQEHK